MSPPQENAYRQLITLADGARVLLRPLTAEDRQALLALYSNLTPEDRRYMRHDVDDPGAVGSWVDALDYDVVYPIVALVGDRIAGHTSLHLNTGPSRHRAEVRVFLAKDFRGRGLGTRLLQAIIDLAKRRSLYLLEAEVVAERTSDVRAFQKLGFEAKCTYEDYFMLPDGTFMDAVHLICRLRTGAQEF
jgi:acetyltransferase